MVSRTSLVHPSTAKLTPDEQAKGVYQYTPPEVIAHRRGEVLSDDDVLIVRQYYGGIIPAVNPEPVKEAPDVCWACIEKDDRYGHTCKPAQAEVPVRGKSLVKLKTAPVFKAPLEALRVIADAVTDSLPDAEAHALLVKLAARFDYNIQ